MDQKTHDKGLEIRKAVLGEAYVANALKSADAFNSHFRNGYHIAGGRVGGGNCRARPAACSFWP